MLSASLNKTFPSLFSWRYWYSPACVLFSVDTTLHVEFDGAVWLDGKDKLPERSHSGLTADIKHHVKHNVFLCSIDIKFISSVFVWNVMMGSTANLHVSQDLTDMMSPYHYTHCQNILFKFSSSQCSTTGVTKAMVCDNLSVGWHSCC